MSVPASVMEAVRPYLDGAALHASAVGGGCIAHATRIETGPSRYFLKWSSGEAAHTFEAEAAGLRALRAAGSGLVIPDVLAVQAPSGDQPGFLLMEWIEQGRKQPGFWEHFADGLAQLHRHAAGSFGFDTDNYIGRLPQHNQPRLRWPDFFRDLRLLPQIERARQAGRWQAAWDGGAEALLARLEDWLPERPEASMLHGDLWSGNFLVTEVGQAALVDPATYYGHREADLAMTELFGGFDRRFYDAYQAAWPLEPGYETRRELYNLYHLINHLNHFGSGYAGSVETTLRMFG